MNKYPDLSSLDINTATNGLVSQMLVVRESMPKPWEQTLHEPDKTIELSDGSWAHIWGDGPPVLFAHGFEGRYSQFALMIDKARMSGFKLVGLEMPGHGRAQALRADPLSFSNAIKAASTEFAPFHTMIGHSQGASAVLHAAANGVITDNIVLLAPLVSVESHLRNVCAMTKLSSEAIDLFLRKVTDVVGVHHTDFEGRILASSLSSPALIIHDHEDREVPIAHAEKLAAQWPSAHLKFSQGLGHRRILADANVAEIVFNFLDKVGKEKQFTPQI